MKRSILVVSIFLLALTAAAQQPHVLRGVKTVQLDPTIVPNPDKVKSDFAPNLMHDSLKDALETAGFTIGEAPIKAHIVLDKFTSGSTAKRVLLGFGAGRSTVEAHLVIRDADGKDLTNIRIYVRGHLAWSPYQGSNSQRRQAVNSFQQRLLEEIERLK